MQPNLQQEGSVLIGFVYGKTVKTRRDSNKKHSPNFLVSEAFRRDFLGQFNPADITQRFARAHSRL